MIAVSRWAVPALLAVSTAAHAGHHEEKKMAGGYGDKPASVVAVAMASEAHSTLVTAVKAAELVDTLQGEGPFTVFAPTNAAFNALPEGTVASLLEPANQEKLQGVLTYHVVAGKLKAKDVLAAIEKGDGEAMVETVAGGSLTVSLDDGNVVITDGQGQTATVTATDLKAKNGVVHVIDTVLMP
ncbi:fasciclin domain-containing protein [Algiphilus sp.]|uniref:fasciclin domain-containing protein n=1 Tax=Algiphilus sp. TaxID=1872431 RepID=UPI003B51F285